MGGWDQEDRNLILFLAGRASKKQGGIKAGRDRVESRCFGKARN
jgi:hypothetical protein